jgi:hypothetical protein
MKRVMPFVVAIACSVIPSVNVATASQSAFALRASARQANGSRNREEVFMNRCGSCHGTERALVAPRTRKGWEAVLAEMANIGAQLEPGDQETILAFLTERYGLVNVNAANAEELVALGLSEEGRGHNRPPIEATTGHSRTSRPFSACQDSTVIG